jgi:hypothetical protein
LRQLHGLEEECARLDQQIVQLAWSPRYAQKMLEISKLCGVGVLTALVFLSELGDRQRFANRRQLGAYLGLVPSSYETGKTHDRKGHITRQGSFRVRKVLCQASWARVRHDPQEKVVPSRNLPLTKNYIAGAEFTENTKTLGVSSDSSCKKEKGGKGKMGMEVRPNSGVSLRTSSASPFSLVPLFPLLH